jgi:hypothetical protein
LRSASFETRRLFSGESPPHDATSNLEPWQSNSDRLEAHLPLHFDSILKHWDNQKRLLGNHVSITIYLPNWLRGFVFLEKPMATEPSKEVTDEQIVARLREILKEADLTSTTGMRFLFF